MYEVQWTLSNDQLLQDTLTSHTMIFSLTVNDANSNQMIYRRHEVTYTNKCDVTILSRVGTAVVKKWSFTLGEPDIYDDVSYNMHPHWTDTVST